MNIITIIIIREVTVTVIDNGVGISKADLSNIFTAYSQVRPEQLQQGRGTGLGLVLAKVISFDDI
jgi:signal transduction histidine kinase